MANPAVWFYPLIYEDNPTITTWTGWTAVEIDPQHRYMLQVKGGGQYDSQIANRIAAHAPRTPLFGDDLIPLDARTNCFTSQPKIAIPR